MTQRVPSTCPRCKAKTWRVPYDLGDGPELHCADCQFCWGLHGQELTARPTRHIRRELEHVQRITAVVVPRREREPSV